MSNDRNPPASRASEELLTKVTANLIISHLEGWALKERRERIATAAMQGLIACGEHDVCSGRRFYMQPAMTAELSREFADALIAELDRGEPLATTKYDELILAVHSKFPGESRHETALRYIRERENAKSQGSCAKAAELDRKGEEG